MINVKLDTPPPVDNASPKEMEKLVDQLNDRIRTLQRNIELIRDKAQEAP